MRTMQLQVKITLLIILIILISIVDSTFFITRWRIRTIKEDVETNIMNIAEVVSNTPVIKTNLGEDNGKTLIQPYVQSILKSINNTSIIVVADMKGIRSAHPNENKVGEKFVGGDENRVIQTGEKYVSQAKGTLGDEIRAFVPVYDEKNKQVGFVMVGQLIKNINDVKKDAIFFAFYASFSGLIVGVIGAVIIGKGIKNTLLGYEPEQISSLYLEKSGILEAMQEGIIAIDNNSKIVMINRSAVEMLKFGIKTAGIYDLMGRDINDVFPACKLSDVLETGKEEKYKEEKLNNVVVVINKILIKDGGNVIGAIATFNDKTIITKLAEEVTGIKQIVEALRANNHEFLNKLHVILGYIQLNRLDDAKKLIIDESDKQQRILSFVMNNILEPTVAALLLGKISRAKELGIKMEIKEGSFIKEQKGEITGSDLALVIGNLLENAMESLTSSDKEDKKVSISIKENSKEIFIKVEDNGLGIDEKILPLIFHHGYSTKGINRGRGLYFIKRTITNLNGTIDAVSKLGEGASFTAIIPKEV